MHWEFIHTIKVMRLVLIYCVMCLEIGWHSEVAEAWRIITGFKDNR